MTPQAQLLLSELGPTVVNMTDKRRGAVCKNLCELFFEGVDQYNDEMIDVFGDVIVYLMEKTRGDALMELSVGFSSLDRAPAQVIGYLARHPEIAVSAPVLQHSTVLSPDAVMELAKRGEQECLVALAGRPDIDETVTDIIVERGGPDVARRLVANSSARLSERSFVKLVMDAAGDRDFAMTIATRSDMPDELRPFIKDTIEKE
jgi:uncharacterized protein (DUF2336 family)